MCSTDCRNDVARIQRQHGKKNRGRRSSFAATTLETSSKRSARAHEENVSGAEDNELVESTPFCATSGVAHERAALRERRSLLLLRLARSVTWIRPQARSEQRLIACLLAIYRKACATATIVNRRLVLSRDRLSAPASQSSWAMTILMK